MGWLQPLIFVCLEELGYEMDGRFTPLVGSTRHSPPFPFPPFFFLSPVASVDLREEMVTNGNAHHGRHSGGRWPPTTRPRTPPPTRPPRVQTAARADEGTNTPAGARSAARTSLRVYTIPPLAPVQLGPVELGATMASTRGPLPRPRHGGARGQRQASTSAPAPPPSRLLLLGPAPPTAASSAPGSLRSSPGRRT
jgi:hypothetical protein